MSPGPFVAGPFVEAHMSQIPYLECHSYINFEHVELQKDPSGAVVSN
jgi:hypothetical protein